MKPKLKTMILEAHAIDRGDLAPARVRQVTRRSNGSIERKELDPETYRKNQAREWKAKTEPARIRRIVNVTQTVFAEMLGVSLGTVRKWESGAIEPSGAARTLLAIAKDHPEIVREAAANR